MHTTASTTSGPGKPFRWGTHFKNGKLYVFTKESVTVVKGWPEMRAWHKTLRHQHWRPVRPTISFHHQSLSSSTPRRSTTSYEPNWAEEQQDAPEPDDPQMEFGGLDYPPANDPLLDWSRRLQNQQVGADREFFAAFPAAVSERLKDFSSRQWHLAALAARCPGAMDLIASNPALAYCLASNWVFHTPAVQRPLRAARALVRRRQRDICGWLGFPATQAVVRCLKKIPPECCEVTPLLYLRSAIRVPSVLQALSHLRCVDSTTLRIVGDAKLFPVTSFNLLVELSASSPSRALVSHQVRLLRDTVEMAGMINEPVASHPFDTLGQLRRRHDELAARFNRKPAADLMKLAFPLPPIPGTTTVLPITNPRMLVEEGCQQSNCVASYAKRVANGRSYIYRVLAPERATLEVKRSAKGWHLAEVALACNRRPSIHTRAAVEAWLTGDGWKPDWQPF